MLRRLIVDLDLNWDPTLPPEGSGRYGFDDDLEWPYIGFLLVDSFSLALNYRLLFAENSCNLPVLLRLGILFDIK